MRLFVPHEDCRAVLEQWRDGHNGLTCRCRDHLIAVHQAESDRIVDVHLGADGLEPDCRSPGPQGQVDSGVLPSGDKSPADGLVVGVDRIAGTKHLEERSHIRLRLPLELNHNVFRTETR